MEFVWGLKRAYKNDELWVYPQGKFSNKKWEDFLKLAE